jgi:hypothetical protein
MDAHVNSTMSKRGHRSLKCVRIGYAQGQHAKEAHTLTDTRHKAREA